MKSSFRSRVLSAVTAATFMAAGIAHAEVVKIAHIDSFSGPLTALNQHFHTTLQFAMDRANKEQWAGPGITFEASTFDGKNNVQESLLQLKKAQDQGLRYVVQGGSSGIAAALIDGISRYNERNPGKETVQFSPTAIAPDLTNERCSFWYFNLDSNALMRSEGVATLIAKDPALKKVFLINQDYATGQQAAAAVRAALKRKRPDIEIVGDELHPMMQVKDFTPYVAKIRASGANVIFTQNFASDLVLLVKAMKESGLKLPIITFNAATTGVPTALAAGGLENIKVITQWLSNDDPVTGKSWVDPFKAKTGDDLALAPWVNVVRVLAEGIKAAKSTDPRKVAAAMEGLKTTGINGEIEMRKADHQLQQRLVVGEWTKADGKAVRYDMEKTGYGFKVVDRIPSFTASTPTSCQMKRPA